MAKKEIDILNILKDIYIYRVELEYQGFQNYEYKSNDLLNIGDIVICEAGTKLAYGRVMEKVHKSEQRYKGSLKKCFSFEKAMKTNALNN